MAKPTIYEALRTKLGREPTSAELNADVRRILAEGIAGMGAFNKRNRPVLSPHRAGLYVSTCHCPECDHHRAALALGRS